MPRRNARLGAFAASSLLFSRFSVAAPELKPRPWRTGRSQIFAKALPLIAVVFMASGSSSRASPWKGGGRSTRSGSSYARGSSGFEARLWEDPFTAMRQSRVAPGGTVQGSARGPRASSGRTA